jgi:hypothetical protein
MVLLLFLLVGKVGLPMRKKTRLKEKFSVQASGANSPGLAGTGSELLLKVE